MKKHVIDVSTLENGPVYLNLRSLSVNQGNSLAFVAGLCSCGQVHFAVEISGRFDRATFQLASEVERMNAEEVTER